MNHGPLLKCTYPWECYHIQNTQLVMPQHKLLHMILSMGHKFKAHENRFWGGKESPRSRALLGEAEGCPGSENSGRVSSRAHGEGRDRGEGVSEREMRSPLDAETSLPIAQLPRWHIQGATVFSVTSPRLGEIADTEIVGHYPVPTPYLPSKNCSSKNI